MTTLRDQTPLNSAPDRKKSQLDPFRGSDSSRLSTSHGGTGISSQSGITSTSTSVISSVATNIITTQPRPLLPAAQDVLHDGCSSVNPTVYSFSNVHPYNSSSLSSATVVSSPSQPSHQSLSAPLASVSVTRTTSPSLVMEPSPSQKKRYRKRRKRAMTAHQRMGMQHTGIGPMGVFHPQATAAATGMQGIQPTPRSMIRVNQPMIGMGHSQMRNKSMMQQPNVYGEMGMPQTHYMQRHNTMHMQPHQKRDHMGHTAVRGRQPTMVSRVYPHMTPSHHPAAVTTPSRTPQASIAERVLTERDIAKLVDLLHNFSSKWNEIGLGLGFTSSELNLISHKPLLLPNAPTSFLIELLSQWVQWPTVNHPTKPILKTFCGTLCSSLVGLGRLAKKVEREMIGECSKIIGQLSQIDGNGSSEPIDIASKIETLEDRFNILQTRIIKELSTKPDITVQELLSQLTRLPLSLRKEYESSIANCFPSMRTETQINELFTAHLNPLTSFIDYGLIEYFIRTFGSDTLKRDMRSYCSEMVIFMKETTIKQLINYFPGQPEVPPKFSLVEAKIGKDASKCTLEQLNIIRRRYCSEVKLSEIVFHLVAVVESNSFIARWLVPSALVNGIIKSTRNVDQSFYQEYNITSLTLDGMWLYLSETEIEAMWLQVSNLKLVHHYHAIHKQILFELKMENTPIDEISQCLMNHYSILQKNTSNILSQAIINYLFPPSGSFIDFEMLSLIVKQFGSNCLRDVMMSYCKYMSGFVKQSTPQHLLDLSPVPSKVDEGFIQAECGIMKEPSECTCDDILNIKNSICTEIDSSRTVFTMYHIRKPQNGSFLVSWVVPAHLSSDLIESVNHINDAFFVRLNIASFSIGNLWVYNPQLVLFGTKLKDKYQQSQGSPSPVEGIPSPTKKIFRLAMIQRERVQRGHIEDRFVRMTIGGRVDDILHAKSPVELEHIFRNILHGGEIILIEGAPGSGKSTLTVHICQRWGKGEIFQQFTVVILVQLRDPAVQRAQTIADLLPVENAAVAQELASELIATNGRGVLWVLDGWDELPPHLQQDSMFHVLIKRMLSECSIIVTSRPISSGDLHPVVSTRIEVLGFTPEEQRQYFTECLKGDTKVLEALLKKITENPVIQSICYLPLNAAFVIHTFNYRGQSLPNTEYEIYLSVILSCIHRHFEREGKDHDLRTELVSFDDLSKNEAVREPFRCLCELAYHGVMKNKVTFSSSDLPQGSNTLSLLQAIESFLQSGKSVFYNFLHLSIQEILSAYYIATWLSDSDQVSQFQQLFNQPRFAAVFQFYAAFTKLKSPGIHEVIDRIVEEKSKPLLLSLLRCLHEAQNPSLCHYVVERLDLHVIDKMQYVIFSLRSSSLFHLDYLSVSFFLSFAGMTIVTDFEYCSIDDLGAKGLSKYLDGSVDHVSKATVICLDISNNHIHEEGASHIARTVNLIEYLDLSCNLIGDTGASAISEAVRETATLKTLILYNCRITSRGGEDLSKALAQNSSLVKLDIGGNNLGDEGISHVADALKHNKQLKELWISYCGMTDKGAASLASALSVNNSLKKLYMGGRDKGTLTENGLSTITQSLANSSEFVKLAVPDGFGSITGHLSREINEARKRNGLQLVKIKASQMITSNIPSWY